MNYSLNPEFEEIEHSLRHSTGRDYSASRGEFLNGKILAAYLGFEFIDAFDNVFFREDGTFDSEKTNAVLSERLSRSEHAVIPGFYGSMPNGTGTRS